MVIAFLSLSFVAIGIVYLTLRSASTTHTLIVDVTGAVDGRTVEVIVDGRKERVILAGIGFPPGDHRSEQDCAEVVEEVVVGRRLYMDVFKEVEGCKYVSLRSSNGDCLNVMMLSKGLARYDRTGVGIVGNLVEAENKARFAGVGVWDKNRALFRHLSGAASGGSHYLDTEIDDYAVDRD